MKLLFQEWSCCVKCHCKPDAPVCACTPTGARLVMVIPSIAAKRRRCLALLRWPNYNTVLTLFGPSPLSGRRNPYMLLSCRIVAMPCLFARLLCVILAVQCRPRNARVGRYACRPVVCLFSHEGM